MCITQASHVSHVSSHICHTQDSRTVALHDGMVDIRSVVAHFFSKLKHTFWYNHFTHLHNATQCHTFLSGKGSVFYQEMSESRRYGERGERKSLGKRASENLVRQRARFCDATWRQLGFIFFLTLSMSLRIEVIRCKDR